MRNFIRALPFELQSARIDGVKEWRIFWFLVLPLVQTTIAALPSLSSLCMERLFWATVLTWPRHQAYYRRINALNGQFAQLAFIGRSHHGGNAPVLMFFLMQKHFIAGLTLGQPRADADGDLTMPKITFIGAGSTIFMRHLLGDALLMPSLRDSEIALMDIDADRLAESELIARRMVDTVKTGNRIPTTSRRDLTVPILSSSRSRLWLRAMHHH